MKAVFLDADTFSINTPKPSLVCEFAAFARTTPSQIIAHASDADIIITNKVVIDKDTIAKLSNLKLIQIAATGTNNVDLTAAKSAGISVKNVAGYSGISVAEHTLMMILNLARGGVHYHHRVSHDWQDNGNFCLNDTPILDLHGKTLGIIGAGDLGKKVGKLASAFGLNVLYAERRGKTPRNTEYTAFDEVLATADIISLHCALTDDTHHLINDDTIAKMRRPIIINMARGGVVDSHAIARALDDGKILGYGADVFENEPPIDDTLLRFAQHPRVFFTPHNGWASVGAQTRLWQMLCAQIDDFIDQHA